MIRAQEKGEFLGPTSSRIQSALSRMVDREIAILERKGAFRPGSMLEPPEALAGKAINVRFSAPMDRLRKASDVVGISRTLEIMGQVAQMDPSVVDNLDSDSTVEIVRNRLGAPRAMFKTPDALAALRDQKKKAQQMQTGLEAANSAADTAAKGAQAMPEIQNLMNNYGGGAGGTPSGSGGLPGLPNPSPGAQ